MNYTISTEVVTGEHIGRKVLVCNSNTLGWDGPLLLDNVEVDFDANQYKYFVHDTWGYFTHAILVVDDEEKE